MSNLGPCARRLVQLRHSLFKSRDEGADIQDPDRQPLEASDAAPLANMENDLSEYSANWRAPHPFDAEDQDAARSPWPLLFLARAWGLALSRPAYETRARRGRATSSLADLCACQRLVWARRLSFPVTAIRPFAVARFAGPAGGRRADAFRDCFG